MPRNWRLFLNAADQYVLSHIFALEAKTVNDLFAEYERAYHRMAIGLESVASRYGAMDKWSADDAQYRQRTDMLMAQLAKEMQMLTAQTQDMTLRAAVDSYQAGYLGRAWITDTLAGGGLLTPLLPAEAVRAAIMKPYEGSTFVDRFKGREEDFQSRIRKSIVQSQIEGETIPQAQRRIALELGLDIDRRRKADKQANHGDFNRTQTIARTEILRTSNLGALAVYEQNKDVLRGWRWEATNDDRTCFPRGTRIASRRGNIPIEKVRVGDFVLTRNGYKRIKAISQRPYNGTMTIVGSGALGFVSTADHPVWTSRGWINAGQLNIGDTIQSINNQFIQVDRLFNFRLSDSNNPIALLFKSAIPPRILPAILMPIIAVYLKGNILYGKVDAISTDLQFRGIMNSQSIKSLSNQCLKFILASKSAITTKIAELASRLRFYADRLSAMCAINVVGRSATLFGAMLASIGPSPKYLSAGNTSLVNGSGAAASNSANRISIGDSFENNKVFAAHRAILGYMLPGISLVVTLTGTIFSLTNAGLYDFEMKSAYNTAGEYAGSVTLMLTMITAIFSAILMGSLKAFSTMLARFRIHTHIISRIVSQNHISVYNLEVDSDHEFYANGILVHNCPICGDLDGKTFTFEDSRNPPPAHPSCRCSATPVLINEDKQRYLESVPTFREWIEKRNIDTNRYGQAYNLKGQKPPKSPKGA